MALFQKKDPTPTTPPKGASPVSKPQSYFSVKEHTFVIKGRKGKPDQDVTELALYFQDSVFSYIKPSAIPGKLPDREIYVKADKLKEIAKVLESGYPEDVTAIVLRELGHKELVHILKDNKILVLDFCQYVAEELAKVPAKPRGRVAGLKPAKPTVDAEVATLAQILRNLAPATAPSKLAEAWKALVTASETKLAPAVALLEEKLKTHGRDKDSFIKLRTRTK